MFGLALMWPYIAFLSFFISLLCVLIMENFKTRVYSNLIFDAIVLIGCSYKASDCYKLGAPYVKNAKTIGFSKKNI